MAGGVLMMSMRPPAAVLPRRHQGQAAPAAANLVPHSGRRCCPSVSALGGLPAPSVAVAAACAGSIATTQPSTTCGGLRRRQAHSAAPAAPTPSQCRPLAKPVRALPELLAAVAASPLRDWYCFVAAAIGAYVWVKIFDTLAAAGVLDKVGAQAVGVGRGRRAQAPREPSWHGHARRRRA